MLLHVDQLLWDIGVAGKQRAAEQSRAAAKQRGTTGQAHDALFWRTWHTWQQLPKHAAVVDHFGQTRSTAAAAHSSRPVLRSLYHRNISCRDRDLWTLCSVLVAGPCTEPSTVGMLIALLLMRLSPTPYPIIGGTCTTTCTSVCRAFDSDAYPPIRPRAKKGLVRTRQ
jgi:hypothetical protein